MLKLSLIIIAFSVVASLLGEIKPHNFVLQTQIIESTKVIRLNTFFEGDSAAHIVFGEQFNKELADIIFTQKNYLKR